MKWIKSSECDSSACVEVKYDGDDVFVRHSRSPLHTLWFTRKEFLAFLVGAKQGDFDEGVNR